VKEIRTLLAKEGRTGELRREAVELPCLDLGERQVWDLELLLNGAFSPLEGYLNQRDYDSVCSSMRLADGSLWPIPIVLDADPRFAERLDAGDRIALRHPEGMVLAILTVESIWTPDRKLEAESVLGTVDPSHPAVFQLQHLTYGAYLGGKLQGVELPAHHTFRHLRHTPQQLRAEFVRRGWSRILGFQTRNPMHRAHVELSRRAAAQAEAHLLLHPVVGRTSPGDVDYFSRVRCYERILRHYPPNTTLLSLLPLSMRMAGPREAVWHALIRRNYGCTHFVVGRDHAGARNARGEPFYGPYEAQELVSRHAGDLDIEIVPFEEMVYCEDVGEYLPRSRVPTGGRVLSLSGTELRRRLREGADVPAWFSYPDVIEQLRSRFPSRNRQGFTVFFTGLSGSGKSTIANILVAKLMEVGTRPVTLLDGDIVRKNLSSELGFSKEHRDLNIRRIGYVASEITKNRGIAVCAPIAPYAAVRREVRELIGQYGGFVEVWVSTPLEVCESRDRKGLYAMARAGVIRDMTGVDDPYEEPERADVVLDTSTLTAEEAAQFVLSHLEDSGYIPVPADSGGATQS
jgi:sulfate adenylyltransferase